ncbi:hypothetical protein [Niabella hirudinis]|uniref:hypothetical protein n=1 Tax=Niabella hirudinis TaxID=1285929 RepID=UPI003EBB1EB2
MVLFIRDFVQIELMNDHHIYSGTFGAYQRSSWRKFLILPFLFLLVVLLPYNFIILSAEKKKKSLGIQKKMLLFTAIQVLAFLLVGSFANIWPGNGTTYFVYLAYMFFNTGLFVTLLHFLVDSGQLIKKALKSERPVS